MEKVMETAADATMINDESMESSESVVETEETSTTQESLKKLILDAFVEAFLKYGVVGSSSVSFILMALTAKMSFKGAMLNGSPYTPFIVLAYFFEFISWFIVPFSAYGLIQTIAKREAIVNYFKK